MLISLQIKNWAIIDSLELEFREGFNVLTGETGAGKSVITGAVGILTGNRADKSMIRQGESKGELSALFRLQKQALPGLLELLEHSEIPFECDEEGFFELSLRRVLTVSGSRNFMNDTPVTAQLLAAAGNEIIDIHAANEHYSLSDNGVQLQLLDRFGGLDDVRHACAESFKNWRSATAERRALLASLPEPGAVEGFRETVNEIKAADFREDEEAQVSADYAVSANAGERLELAGSLNAMLTESEDSLSDRLSAMRHHLDRLAHLDPGAESFLENGSELLAKTLELSRELERYARKIELDESRLRLLDERLALIQRMKRRHGGSLKAVLEKCAMLEERIQTFDHASENLAALEKKESEAYEMLCRSAASLHGKRSAAAQKLSVSVSDALSRLGFLKARFDVEFQTVEPGADGADKIEFLFSANPGERPGHLRSIASSGELSRVMLALKTVLADADSVPVLLFDEIDVNIGGETARTVGAQLRKLAANRQIICISHLAQVAAHADEHVRVGKTVENDRTLTRADILEPENRIDEIARMLGGGPAARQHAESLIRELKADLPITPQTLESL